MQQLSPVSSQNGTTFEAFSETVKNREGKFYM
jgi:hypothetical protein